MKSTKTLALIFLVTFILNTPLFITNQDMWDGVILSLAAQLNDYSGVKIWFYESSWYLQYFYVKTVGQFSSFLNINFKLFDKFLQIFYIICTAFVFTMILEKSFYFKKPRIIFSILFFLTFPIWHICMTSLVSMYLFCTLIGMVSIYLLTKIHTRNKIIGLILLFISAQLNSLLIFIPGFLYAIDVSKNSLRPSKQTILVSLYCLVLLIMRLVFIRPYGIYEGYNSPINFQSLAQWQLLIDNVQDYLTYLNPTIVIACLILLAKRDFKTLTTVCNLKNLSFVIIIASSIAAYLGTGHANSLAGTDDWDGRQAILLSFGTSMLASSIFFGEDSSSRAFKLHSQSYTYLLAFLVLAVNLYFLELGYITKTNRATFDKKLLIALENYKSAIPDGKVIFISDSNALPVPIHRSYELNYLLYQSLENFHHFGFFISKDQSKENLKSSHSYQIPLFLIDQGKKYSMSNSYEHSSSTCTTEILVAHSNYLPLQRRIYYFLYPQDMKVNINNIVTKC